MKRIGEVFSEYITKGTISNAVVEAVVITKKTKTLEMKISSDQLIEAGETEGLQAFIKERFALDDVKIIAEYTGAVPKRLWKRN
jgi:DNA polymerase-3 subunit alpha (Gram-positive type)